jgi:hypothetical protein
MNAPQFEMKYRRRKEKEKRGDAVVNSEFASEKAWSAAANLSSDAKITQQQQWYKTRKMTSDSDADFSRVSKKVKLARRRDKSLQSLAASTMAQHQSSWASKDKHLASAEERAASIARMLQVELQCSRASPIDDIAKALSI